jgi:hypothetical protein
MTDLATNEYSAGIASVRQTVLGLRNRARVLRIQAYTGVSLIVVLVITLIVGFTNVQRGFSNSPKLQEKPREPYDYRLMESRHNAISEKLTEINELLTKTKQEVVYDRYANKGVQQKTVLESLEARIEELKKVKSEIDDRLSRDRQNMTSELSKIKDERDYAIRSGGERYIFLQLLGDVAFRFGILVLALYLISIISNISKYTLRVADHLNSAADSIDLLLFSGLSPERGISALTPHPIDFQIDEALNPKHIKSWAGFFSKNSKTSD